MYLFACVLLLNPVKYTTIMYLVVSYICFIHQVLIFNTSYLTDSYIGFTLKMESVTETTILGLKMMVKSGLEISILKSLHAGR